MCTDTRKALALLRIKRNMPDEFKAAGLRYGVHDRINGPMTRREMSKANALAIFGSWAKRTRTRKDQTLSVILDPRIGDNADPLRRRFREKIARKVIAARHPRK